MKVYEVGTFEQYEAGFHAFYRSLNESKAKRIYELAKRSLLKVPELKLDASNEDMEEYLNICNAIDSEFISESGIEFYISNYSGGSNEIQIYAFDLDE